MFFVEGDIFRVTGNDNLFYEDISQSIGRRMSSVPLEEGDIGIVIDNKIVNDDCILLLVFIKGIRGMIINDIRLEKL